jgi:hypothetical protein
VLGEEPLGDVDQRALGGVRVALPSRLHSAFPMEGTLGDPAHASRV